MTDPVIWITESIYIQIGSDYVVIFRSCPSILVTYECSFRIEDIMSKLKQAINDKR